jgi:hypothetical protein
MPVGGRVYRPLGLVPGAVVGAAVGLATAVLADPWTGLWVGLTAMCVTDALAELAVAVAGIFFLVGPAAGLLVGWAVGVWAGAVPGLLVGAVVGVTVTVVALLGGTTLFTLMAFDAHEWGGSYPPLPGRGDAAAADPRASWRNNLAQGLRYAAAVLLVVSGLIWLQTGSDGLALGLTVGAMCGLTVGVLQRQAYASAYAFLVLRLTHGVPVRLLRFLDDAYDRGVMRTVGPIYQFRHARLQDRLAEEADVGAALESAREP